MTTLSLLRCLGCGQVTGDVRPSRRDREPRCGPCDRRADHDHRLATGDRWYGNQVIDFAERHYGPEWEQLRGWQFCADLFADTRALGGWKAVGVEMPTPRSRLEVTVRPCPVCGAVTTSLAGYLCASCHFRGWWGPWRDDDVEPPAA
jgi:hypothetical protein